MSEAIDREKLSHAFSFLASEKGEGSLDKLQEGLDQFRSSLGEDLNDAEFKYLSNALLQQKSNNSGEHGGLPLNAGRSVSAASNLRHGFVIKAKI